MYFNGLSVFLKSPSPVSIECANQKRQSRYKINLFCFFLLFQVFINLLIFRFKLTDHETNVLTSMKSSITTELVSSEEFKDYPGIFKRAKGPNPLSCKSKKKKTEDDIPKVQNKIKRKRQRVKIPKHVKDEFKKMYQQSSNK